MTFGNPSFRFTLSHSSGNLQISEPDGWSEAKLKLERHPDFYSLIEYFEGSFIFYGDDGVDNGGLNYIRAIEHGFGVDAKITFTVEITFDDGDTFETIFTGLLDLYGLQEMKNNKAEIPIIRNDFWAKFINRRETPVNIQSTTGLDGDSVTVKPPGTVHFLPQKLRETYFGNSGDLYNPFASPAPDRGEVSQITSGYYYQVDFINEITTEIKEKYTLPLAENPVLPVELIVTEFGGSYSFQIKIYAWTDSGLLGGLHPMKGAGPPSYDLMDFYLSIKSGQGAATEYIFDYAETFFNGVDLFDGVISKYTYTGTHQLEAKAAIKIYGKANTTDNTRIKYVWNGSTMVDRSEMTIVADTVYPATSGDGFLLHDVGAMITDRIISRNTTFFSEYLGSVDTIRNYGANGCGWKNILVQGLQVRGYNVTSKQFSMSFDDWWKGADPILALGLTYETIGNQEVIRVEGKEHFFNPVPSVYIDNVYEITREYDKDKIYKKVTIGYSKWQAEDVSGIDDPQSRRVYATRLQMGGSEANLLSGFIAASLAIETTRRSGRVRSEDYKFDNDFFIIAITGDLTSPDAFVPELEDNFRSVSNLLNDSSRYNLRLTPARNLLRWIKFLNAGLQSYIGSAYKFVSGEGNYHMISTQLVVSPDCGLDDFNGQPLSESGNIPVTQDYVFLAQEYKIEIDLSWDDYVTIRNNRKQAIGISQTTENHQPFFIKTLEYEVTKGKATITCWPVNEFALQVVDFVPEEITCSPIVVPPVTASCDDALVDSLGNVLVDDDGNCLTF